MSSRDVSLWFLTFSLTFIACGSDSKAPTAKRPNIVLLLADDMGYSDIGSFGGEIETPHLDRLAEGGVRFTQFYNAGRCCPTRASLLTGLYPHQAGVGLMTYRDYGEGGYRGNLNDACVTFGEVLQSAGYRTLFVGKWHVGHDDPQARPEVRGFEHVTGIYPHIDSYWKILPGCEVHRDREMIIPAGENPVNPYRPGEEFYTTDFFTDAAIDYIDQAAADETKPFLLYVAYNAPHFPLEAHDDLIEKYRGRYKSGWDELREEKLERMKRLGIVDPDVVLPSVHSYGDERRPGFSFNTVVDKDALPAWASLSESEKDELDFRRAMYSAQIDRLDQNIGRIVAHLEERRILDDTLILFLSDNGCSGELGDFGMNWGKYTSANYSEWRKQSGWSVSQGQGWAHFSNTPLRKYKRFVHEGGIATPFIAHWPSGITRPGRIDGGPFFHIIDIMPTLLEVGGARYPETRAGKSIPPTPGSSMLPFLTGGHVAVEERTLYWHHEVQAAIREGDWKLVTLDDRAGNWELYNLAEDRTESEDLSRQFPDRAERLAQKWRRWAETAGVLPYPEDLGEPRDLWPPTPWPESVGGLNSRPEPLPMFLPLDRYP